MGNHKYILCLMLLGLMPPETYANDQCVTWAIKRIVGSPEDAGEVAVTNGSTYTAQRRGTELGPEPAEGRGRQGKRGAPGPQGERGPMGPPGICSCIPQEVTDLQAANEILKDQVRRMRTTSPEVFCLLGMKSGAIPDSAITVSEVPSRKTHGRLDSPSEAWHPYNNNAGSEWIMADLGKARLVTGIVIQGRPISDHWTKTLKVEHSLNGTNFIDVKKPNGSELIFSGNSDRNTKVVNRFPHPVTTRYVRIYPITYHNHMMVRFDVIDC